MGYSVPSKDRMPRGRRPSGILSCENMVTPTQPISVKHFDALYSINCLKLCKVAGALKHREIAG